MVGSRNLPTIAARTTMSRSQGNGEPGDGPMAMAFIGFLGTTSQRDQIGSATVRLVNGDHP